jgi:ABC-type lipoprotein release transport system permease subunit
MEATRTAPVVLPRRRKRGAYLSTLAVIVSIAFRNLFASRLKTIIVGGIIFFGALLVVVGGALVDSIDRSMSRSIIGSVAGHIQVYSARSKDELEVMGGFSMEAPDITPVDDFARMQQTLLKLPNVKAVVPMGIDGAIVSSGNTIDVALEKLRDTVRKRQAGDRSGVLTARYEAEKGHVRQMVTVLKADSENVRKILDEAAVNKDDAVYVAKAASDQFWVGFDADPLGSLEFLENRIAPQATDADMLFLRYVGTDPAAFARSFDRMRILDGQAIPPGKRGFMFSKIVYEEQLKLKTAHRLDKIKEARNERAKKIADDPELQRFVRENSSQVREILLQLDAPRTAEFRTLLQRELGSTEPDVSKLLAAFFHTDDSNFDRRYDFFYKALAPALDLYRVRVGDTLVIKAFTRSGYMKSVKLRVYGTFAFSGLENSQLAGALNVMDLVSFRELYGFLTADRQAEIAAIKASSGAREVDRDKAEAELFGSRPADNDTTGKTIEATATPGLPKVAGEGIGARMRREDLVDRVYDPKELKTGVVLNAAVILNDPRKLDATMKDIEAAGAQAGIPLKAISWQKASGFLGQMVSAMHAVLFTAVLIIFVVALVIINNALVMATLQRVPEFGTLRALGAQRRFILTMLVVEALVIGVIFGALGAAVGSALVAFIGKVGIPAFNDIASFFFSGPRLHPSLGLGNVIGAVFIVFVVSVLSSFYPGWLAMRVTPRQAMQTEE